MCEQLWEYVVAVLLPGTGGRAGIVLIAEHNLERRVRWIAGEIFVGIDIEIGGMIDREQLDLIEVDRFFERFHKTKAQFAVFCLGGASGEFDGFGWASNVALDFVSARRDPVSDDACT